MGKITEDMLERETLRASKGGHDIEFAVLPLAGAHLASFAVDGRELLHFSREAFLERGPTTGSFVMFPTPCRLTDCKYVFDGREVLQRKGGEDVDIHGLIRDEAVDVERGDEYLAVGFEIEPGHSVHEGYPFTCALTFRYEIIDAGLQFSFRYENRGDRSAPFGLGVHPFWKLDPERGDNFIRVPCSHSMAEVELYPTGELDPVEDTALDLRDWTSLAGVEMDTAFCGRISGRPGGLERRHAGARIAIDASPEFTHMISYAPPGQPFVCIENLTCSPDAPNVFARGYREASGLVVVAPGESYSGWVTWVVESL